MKKPNYHEPKLDPKNSIRPSERFLTGYQPNESLDINNPPQGGSGVTNSKLPENTCCQLSKHECANERTKKFINKLFDLVLQDRNKANDVLYMYMENVETDRDYYKYKYKEIYEKKN